MTHSTHETADARIARFLSGETSGQVHDFLRQDGVADNTAELEISVLKRADALVRLRRPEPNVELALDAHRSQRRVATPLGVVTRPMLRRRDISRLTSLGIMTVALLLAIVGLRYLAPADPLRVWSKKDSSDAAQTYVTRIGQSARVLLPDGSAVTMAPGSRLNYATDVHGARTVVLDGEALFTVIHNDDRPFTVRANETNVRVLGTTFVVRRFADDTVARVIVAQGRVAVNSNVVSSGEVAVVDRHSVIQIEQGSDLRSVLSWTTGSLQFRRTPLREVVADIQRWFGGRWVIAAVGIESIPITATFLPDAPDEAIEILQTLLGVPVTRDGDVVRIG